MTNFLTITAFISKLRQSLEFLSHTASWNYFYLVFYKRNKSRSVLDKQWGLRLSTPLQNFHTIIIWAASPGEALRAQVDNKEAASLIHDLSLTGPHCAHSLHKYHWVPLCSGYSVGCWAFNAHRETSSLLELTIRWGTGAEANDMHDDDRMCPGYLESKRRSI